MKYFKFKKVVGDKPIQPICKNCDSGYCTKQRIIFVTYVKRRFVYQCVFCSSAIGSVFGHVVITIKRY